MSAGTPNKRVERVRVVLPDGKTAKFAIAACTAGAVQIEDTVARVVYVVDLRTGEALAAGGERAKVGAAGLATLRSILAANWGRRA